MRSPTLDARLSPRILSRLLVSLLGAVLAVYCFRDMLDVLAISTCPRGCVRELIVARSLGLGSSALMLLTFISILICRGRVLTAVLVWSSAGLLAVLLFTPHADEFGRRAGSLFAIAVMWRLFPAGKNAVNH